ncbi:hypothetical protein O3P69_001461 [Scylla paramamosain]|uniref:Uncharacterized protein n=1 Tax=Scylla paramamosain TaxID=85552 RepID=A0AAW0V2M3_SCYPA
MPFARIFADSRRRELRCMLQVFVYLFLFTGLLLCTLPEHFDPQPHEAGAGLRRRCGLFLIAILGYALMSPLFRRVTSLQEVKAWAHRRLFLSTRLAFSSCNVFV